MFLHLLYALWSRISQFVPVFMVLCFSSPLLAQKKMPPAAGDNLVPNPSFERFSGPPLGWSYRGVYFGQVVKYWFSATTASPDVYGPGVRVPPDWAAKGFGDQKPRTGQCMAGLTLYGCDNGKPHCREYLEIQLAEPLVIGQTYQLSYWVAPLARSLRIDNLGGYVSVSRIEAKTDEILIREAPVQTVTIVEWPSKGQWVQVTGTFQAKYEAEYLLIGNFKEDKDTHTKAATADAFNYAYYYVDDVSLKKVPPYLPPPVKADDLTRVQLTPGKKIRLKDIYFEFDKDELMPRSYVELDKLRQLLEANPRVRIEIVGHTDSQGADAYNLTLSRRRAKAVADYLAENHIAASRFRHRGEGETKPIADNETDEGRQLNRRVEFVVLE